jgi:hypothetical protein
MYKIDQTLLNTQGKILFNISEQLAEIIEMLKAKPIKPDAGEIATLINRITTGYKPTKAEIKKIEQFNKGVI